MRLRTKFMTLIMAVCLSSGSLAAPQAPTGLQSPALSVTEDGLTLMWERPQDGDMVAGYSVYMDGKCVGCTTEAELTPAEVEIEAFYQESPDAQRAVRHIFHLNGLETGSYHGFTVRAYDENCEESPDSNAVYVIAAAAGGLIDATACGAKGDGIADDTVALQKAIDSCPAGGTVLIPAGVYKTGSLWLKSDMTLELAESATIMGSDSPEDYLSGKSYNCLINAVGKREKLKNIRIIGSGIIDGNGWRADNAGNYLYRGKTKDENGEAVTYTLGEIGILAANEVNYLQKNMGVDEKKAYTLRSSLILIKNAENVYIEGVTLQNPANHCLQLQRCDNSVVENVNFKTYNCNNGDGIEFSNASGLIVADCIFDTGDDSVNFAAGVGKDGAKGKPTENIWIFNNSFHHGHGMVVMGSHTAAGINNVLAEDNVADGTDIGLRMKTSPTIGGGSSNVIFRNNAMRNLQSNGFIFTTAYTDHNAVLNYSPADTPGCFHNITVKNCTVDGTQKAGIEIVGDGRAPHHDINFQNIVFTNSKPWVINNASNVSFINVKEN